MEQYYRDGQKDKCKFMLPNTYLCFRSSVMDEEKRQQFLQGNATRCVQEPHVTDAWESK